MGKVPRWGTSHNFNFFKSTARFNQYFSRKRKNAIASCDVHIPNIHNANGAGSFQSS